MSPRLSLELGNSVLSSNQFEKLDFFQKSLNHNSLNHSITTILELHF